MDFIDFLATPPELDATIRCELRHPQTGAAITSGGHPCVVLCWPKEGPQAQRIVRLELSERTTQAMKAEAGEVREIDFDRMQFEINRYAVALVAGFENMQTAGEDGPRPMTIADVEAFARNPWFSEMSVMHQQRRALGVRKRKGETDAELEARKTEWLGASFAQQIIDAVEAHSGFLGVAGKG